MADKNSYIELIYQMIDGEASEVERQTLFSALNDDPELQAEFQNALSINNAGKSFAASQEVPSHLTNSLFSKAGLTYAGGSAGGNAADAGKHSSGRSAFWASIGGKYGLGAIGLVLGGIIGFLFFGEQNSDQEILQSSERSNEYVYERKENITDNSKEIIKEKNEIIKEKNLMIAEMRSALKSANDSKMQIIDEKRDIQAGDVRQLKTLLKYDTKPDIQNNNISPVLYEKDDHDLDSKMDYKPMSIFNVPSEGEHFSLEINSSAYWNIPEETIYPEEISKLHNMNIFLYYFLNDYLSIGIGARQETFFVKYRTNDDLSREFIYEQQPNLTNIEFSARYSPFDLKILDPYLQFNSGGSTYGYTFRLGAGSEINIYDNIAFTFLLEYATLRYNHKDIWHNANKFGINYGINYKF